MDIKKITAFNKEKINVLIETPKGSSYKYDFDPGLNIFQLNKIMPLGMMFPFDFGFIPGTKGGDGDPLDVLVLMDQALIQGSLLCCRPLALLEASQKERDGREERNDRIIATSEFSTKYVDEKNFIAGHQEILHQIETFFKEYNNLAGKVFQPIHWHNGEKVFETIKNSLIA